MLQPKSQLYGCPFACCFFDVAVCFTGRLRVRPIERGSAYTWSRDLSLIQLWQIQEGAHQQQAAASSSRGAEAGGFQENLPKLDLLRCCPLSGGAVEVPKCGEEGHQKDQTEGGQAQKRLCDYHMVVLYCQERLFHSSFSCIQLKVSFEAPLRLASNIPFPVRFASLRPLTSCSAERLLHCRPYRCFLWRLWGYFINCSCPLCFAFRYRVHSPLVLKVGENPPEDSEGLLKLNECQQIHSFPLAGKRLSPAGGPSKQPML